MCKASPLVITLVAVATLSTSRVAAERPKGIVIVGPKACRLERYAAGELCRYLDKLYGITTEPTTMLPESAGATFIVGSPETNPAVADALGEEGWPKLSDQGIVLKRGRLAGKPVFVIGGGSPVATLWAVYELVERWGVRYLIDRDVLPAQRQWSGLPNVDVVMEPNMRIRCWRLVNDLAHGPVSWSLQENQRFLHQIAKMKYNRIHVQLWPVQPFVHYTFRGVEKPPGVLYFGQKHPIDNDTIGREKFGAMKVFTNPELVGADSPEEVRRRAIGLVRGILKEAKALGMETGLSIAPLEWPKEFMKVLPGSEPVHQLGGLTAGPGAQQSMDDPLLREMVATIVRAYIETYPDIDYLHIGTPEHRGWTGQAEEAYKRLASRYKLSDLGTYDELCAMARSRTSFPNGGARVEAMLKGDLAFLDFFDSLVREKQLLRRPGGGSDIKLVYNGVVAELFPLVARMVPPGGEVLSFIDYTASRQLRQRDLLEHVPPRQTPASLIFTLADDNVGVLPQLATGSLHTLMGDLRKNDWSGFYTRYWTVSDQDPTVHYLARASWDASMTPQQAYTDQVAHVCGPHSVEPALQAFALLEKVTLRLDQHALGFAFPVPGMMTKHYAAGGVPDAIREDRELYRKALAHMKQAGKYCRPEGRPYLDRFVGRLHFAVRYLDAAEAFGATAKAEKANKLDEARQQIDTAYAAIREALEAYVATVKDHGDLGAVALMNEYCYRPIRDKRTELRADDKPDDFIAVRQPKLLPEKIPCSRIALGRKGDYKPCIAKLPNGELLIVAFDVSHKKINGGFREDMLLWRSRDGGRTWSKRQVLPLLGREPYFSVLKDGTLLITVHFLKQDVRNNDGYVYSLLHRSTDGGRTWESTKIGWEDVPGAPEKSWIFTSRNVLELQDGTLVFGVSAPGGIAYLWKSKDGGKSWDKTLSCDFQGVDKSKLWWPFMGETVFWQARNGDLLGLFRVDPKLFPPIPGTTVPQSKLDQYERLLLFRSKDGGRNWRPEEFGSYYGEMYPALLRLNDGRLLLTFTLRTAVPPNTKPLGVRCLVGRETRDGFAFDFKHDRIMVSAKTPADSLSGGGFGPTVQLDDATLLTAYSYAGKDGYPTDLRIEVVRWKLPKAMLGEMNEISRGKEGR